MKVIHEKPWYFSAFSAFLAEDVPRLAGIPPAALARDVTTLERRCTAEGEAFLMKTLPSFGKAFDQALQGVSPFTVPGFRKKSRKSALPAFLQALTTRIFSADGALAETPDPIAIRLVRQICFGEKR